MHASENQNMSKYKIPGMLRFLDSCPSGFFDSLSD